MKWEAKALETHNPKEVFRANLHRLAGVHGLDCDGLLAALQWRRGDKKWLQRVWRHGLERADARTQQLLRTLALALGIQEEEFWLPDVLPRPQRMANRRHNPWLRSSYAFTEWSSVVDQIRRIIKNLPVLWGREPERVIAVRSQYRTESNMIAAWVSSLVGGTRLPPDEQALLKVVLEEEASETTGGSLVDQLLSALLKHPKWNEMLRAACRQCGEEFLEEYLDLQELPSGLRQRISRVLLEAISRPLTLEEAVARAEVQLGVASASTPQDEVKAIIEELQLHPAWDDHLRMFDGDPDKEIANMWQQARLHTSVEQFVSTYRKLRLDEFLTPDDEQPRGRHGLDDND